MLFKDRREAGRMLAENLNKYKGEEDLLILGIPRGGVVVAKEIAGLLNAPLDIVVTRKIGHPSNPEFAIAAVDESGNIIKGDGIFLEDETYIKNEAENQKNEIKRRLKEYRGEEKHPDFRDKICILIDDGIATGLTTKTAIHFIRRNNPKKIILALPVIPADKIEVFKKIVDELYYIDSPEIFFSVGQFYENFPQVEDEEVKEILKK